MFLGSEHITLPRRAPPDGERRLLPALCFLGIWQYGDYKTGLFLQLLTYRELKRYPFQEKCDGVPKKKVPGWECKISNSFYALGQTECKSFKY